MGIGRQTAECLLREAIRQPFTGSVLQLGRQSIWMDSATINLLANKYKVKQPLELITDDQTFFHWLGFKTVESCDIRRAENPTHIFSLTNSIPMKLYDRYDVIIDGGTLEHIFDLPSALANIYHMLKVGGRILHFLPVNNYIDHGFYSFSPTLFQHYYTANRWKLNEILMLAMRDDRSGCRFLRYNVGCLKFIRDSAGWRDTHATLVDLFVSATKMAESTCNVHPVQERYGYEPDGTLDLVDSY